MPNKSFFTNIILFAFVAFVITGCTKQVTESPTTSPTPATEQDPKPTVDNDLGLGGSSYADPTGVFTVLYPNEYAVDSQENAMTKQTITRLTKRGATQKGQTEIYDGVLIVFEVTPLEGKTLEQWVDESIKQSTENGMSELTSPKKATTLQGYKGFTYKIRGLGESEYLVIQKDANSQYGVVITTLVADPEKVGYQREVDEILRTLELQK